MGYSAAILLLACSALEVDPKHSALQEQCDQHEGNCPTLQEGTQAGKLMEDTSLIAQMGGSTWFALNGACDEEDVLMAGDYLADVPLKLNYLEGFSLGEFEHTGSPNERTIPEDVVVFLNGLTKYTRQGSDVCVIGIGMEDKTGFIYQNQRVDSGWGPSWEYKGTRTVDDSERSTWYVWVSHTTRPTNVSDEKPQVYDPRKVEDVPLEPFTGSDVMQKNPECDKFESTVGISGDISPETIPWDVRAHLKNIVEDVDLCLIGVNNADNTVVFYHGTFDGKERGYQWDYQEDMGAVFES